MLSIIIPTFNRCQQLKLTLLSIVKSGTSRDLFEIIIVDNGSTDETENIVFGIIQSNLNTKIRYVFDNIPGLLTGRHRGAQEANGDIFVFVDDDIVVTEHWLDTIIEVMSVRNDVSFLTGPNIPEFATDPPNWLNWFWKETPYGGKECAWLSLLDMGENEIEIDPGYVWGLNFTIRRRDFIDLGGFHPDNIPKKLQHFQGDGETGLTNKGKNKKALYHPLVAIKHCIPQNRCTYEYFDERSYYQGVCASFYSIRENGGKLDEEILQITTANHTKINPAKPNLKERIKIRTRMRKLVNYFLVSEKSKLELILKKRFVAKFHDGYMFHQNAVKNNSTLRQWVIKEDYFNYKLPEL
jgi:glycosyltransferase involved in cell wall biosynthesis